MATKKLANQIAKEWNTRFSGHSESTKTVASVLERGKSFGVEIYATGMNDGFAFFHIQELAMIEKYYNVRSWIGFDKEKQQVYAHIF